MIAKLFHISTEGSDHGHKPRLKRKYIYYALTAMMGVVVVSVRLNTQLVIVNNLSPESSLLPWELVLMGWGSFIYAMGSLFLASLSDRFGRLPCIAVTAFILAGLNVILGWNILGPYQLWHLFLCWGMVSLCFSIFFTGVEGLLSEYQDHSMPLARRLGLYCISWSTGGFVASFLTGYGKELLGPEVIFMSVSLVCFAVLTVTLLDFLFHGTRKIGEQEVGEADIRPEAPFHASLARIGLFFGSLAFAALSASFPRFARDFHQLGEGAVGSFLSTITFTAFLTFAWFPLWNWWHYRAKLQVLLQGFMLAGLILLLMAPQGATFLIRLSLVLYGAGYGFCYFFSIYYSLLVPAGHARSGGVHEGFLGLGKLFGPFAALAFIWFAGKTSLLSESRLGAAAIAVAALAVLFSLLVQYSLVKKRTSGVVP